MILVCFLPLMPGASELNFSVILGARAWVLVEHPLCLSPSPAALSWSALCMRMSIVWCSHAKHRGHWGAGMEVGGLLLPSVMSQGLEQGCWCSCRDGAGFQVFLKVESSGFAGT